MNAAPIIFSVSVTLNLARAAFGAVSFEEDFSASTVSPLMNVPSEFTFGPNSSPIGTAQNSSGIRRYISTVATDFNLVDFVFEITFTVNGPTAAQTPFIGIGSALADPNFFFEPHTSAYFRQFPDDFASGELRFTVSTNPQTPPNQPSEFTLSGPVGPGNGTHRARITKFGDLITFSEDADYTGGFFTPDFSVTRSLSSDLSFLNSGNSRLFFGVQSGNTTLDDLTVTVVPEPGTAWTSLLLTGFLVSRRQRRRTKS